MKKLPPILQSILQILLMIVLALFFGTLILIGANYFDDRPREASIFFLIVGALGILNWFRKRRKNSAGEVAVIEEAQEVENA